MTKQEKLNRIARMVEAHDRMKKAFFWRPPSGAAQRRSYEEQNSDAFKCRLNGKDYEIVQEVECSCRNIYYKLTVNVDGVSKNVRALKALAND